MNKTNSIRPQIPVGVFFIAGFYLFGAILLLISLFINPVVVSRTVAQAHSLPPVIDAFILPVIVCLALLIAYGLFTRARWGYLLTLIYLIIFGSVSFWLVSQNIQQPYIGNTTWSILALLFLIWKWKYFLSQ